ncbi:lipocalin-like domain-containing protein [Pedobacter sp. AW31-3R]|uniref:lipocalin-like domain-containing protein n=1 Tax=Pedobacter sp. AW31-3R TaxID=3445781 RepID=UPI003FA1000B
MKQKACLAKSEKDYNHLNLKPGKPAIWEDGMRTDGGKGSFEWWYFDAHLADGSKIVIIFYTKPMTDLNKPLAAYATFNVDYKDGSKLERYLPSQVFSAAREQCDVKIGDCRFKGDLKNYSIQMEGYDNFHCEVEFTAETESWRPETGYIHFGDKGNYFAWLVAVPKGKVKIKYTIGELTADTTGTCYHDHNWGNTRLHKIIDHWYWSRSEFGPYTIIASQIIPDKRYGISPVNLIYVMKDGIKITDDASYVELFRSWPDREGLGNKPVSNELIFRYDDGNKIFELHLKKKRSIIETYLIQQEPQRKLAKLFLDFNGAYFRLTGEGKLNVFINDELPQCYRNEHAIWELMYFGNPS